MARATATHGRRFAIQFRDRASHDSAIVRDELALQADREPGQLDQLPRRSDQPQALDDTPVQIDEVFLREWRQVDRDRCHQQDHGIAERQAK
jgi:hypothetical protein